MTHLPPNGSRPQAARAAPPNFWVGPIPIYGDAILSPMAGYSDVPYRAICRAHGSAMNYTEFVAAELLQGRPNHFWSLLDRQPGEQPMVFQIFGNDARMMLQAAQRINTLSPDIIDVNMGCSTRKVSGRGAGVGMMRQPKLVAETFALLSQHLNTPITAKMRLGWDDQVNYLEIARILEDNGAALIALHGRTKEQKYGGTANWDAIAALKQAVRIPVIGNGDVSTPAGIAAMKAYTGCDAVMIGRAAIGNPWIFARRTRESLTFAELLATIRQHQAEMMAYYGRRGISAFRKHLKRYLAGIPLLEPLLTPLMMAGSANEVQDLLAAAEQRVSQFAGPPHQVRLAQLFPVTATQPDSAGAAL